jgi:hypothetical protein
MAVSCFTKLYAALLACFWYCLLQCYSYTISAGHSGFYCCVQNAEQAVCERKEMVSTAVRRRHRSIPCSGHTVQKGR